MSENYELVVFTAGTQEYADPVLDEIDKKGLIQHRLYRHHCSKHFGLFIKDLSKVGRSQKDTILLDNSRFSYAFQTD